MFKEEERKRIEFSWKFDRNWHRVFDENLKNQLNFPELYNDWSAFFKRSYYERWVDKNSSIKNISNSKALFQH